MDTDGAFQKERGPPGFVVYDVLQNCRMSYILRSKLFLGGVEKARPGCMRKDRECQAGKKKKN